MSSIIYEDHPQNLGRLNNGSFAIQGIVFKPTSQTSPVATSDRASFFFGQRALSDRPLSELVVMINALTDQAPFLLTFWRGMKELLSPSMNPINLPKFIPLALRIMKSFICKLGFE